MDRDKCKKYLRMLGSELQQHQITGDILLSDGIAFYLDVKKPKAHIDINAYWQGDESAIAVPKNIASYFS